MAVITISRQYASGGDEIATRVCALLGYRYFDKWLISQLTASAGPGEVVDFHEDDYRMRSFLDRLLGRTPPRPARTGGSSSETPDGGGTRAAAELDEQAAIGVVQAAVRTGSDLGNVVIVGRGGQAILRDKPDVVHLRIEAPLARRIERLRSIVDFTYAAAVEEIRDRDRTAAGYIKRFYGVDWADPTLYHMVINTGRCDLDVAARLIVSAVQLLCASAPV